MKLKNKVWLITGSASVIGYAMAETFSKNGANVVVADLNCKEAVKKAKQIEKKAKIKTLAVEAETALFLASFPTNALTGQSIAVAHGSNMK